ncbi:MAG: hypothetical protein AAF135_00420 [Bacteroidota bacterium]
MADRFEKVSLGFAEFVSQLLQETYDSILSAQNHQLERLVEMDRALNMPTDRFIDRYLSEAQVEAKMEDVFGEVLKAQMRVSKALQATIEAQVDSLKGIVNAGKLTNAGFAQLFQFIQEMLVEEQKGILETVLNRIDSTQLIVDSGEITAKLELSNWEEIIEDQDNLDPTPKIRRPIKTQRFEDPETKRTYLLVDRQELQDMAKTNWVIPRTRLTVTPLKAQTETNVFAEVKIKFKNR